jgi:pimeloyl-ACP methyl ester carboxylesterase
MSYGSVLSNRGHRVRTVVSRPTATGTRRIPAILFIPWLSCDAVERPEPGTDGFMHTLHALAANSRMLFMRVEKPGVGDSEGPDCRDAELDDDMAGFRAALASLRARADVDTARIFLVGGSIGGALAPILAAEDPRGIAGVVAINGFGRTWYEHMLDIERRILELRGVPAREVNTAMRGIARFYTEYLLGSRTPSQVIASHPELRALWTDEPEHQYGRPASYYHAVQRLDVEGAWATLAERGIPALVVWGEYDWIMSRLEADRAIAIVNAKRPGLATLAVLPRTDHGLMTYASMQAAFADGSPVWDGAPANAILSWLRAR